MFLRHLFFNLQIPLGGHTFKAYGLKLMIPALRVLNLRTTRILRSTLLSEPTILYCDHNIEIRKS